MCVVDSRDAGSCCILVFDWLSFIRRFCQSGEVHVSLRDIDK